MIKKFDSKVTVCAPGIGKNLSVAPSEQTKFEILKRAAKTSYYPKMAMKHLEALNLGLSGRHNVFIPNTKDFLSNSFQKVVVYVPGISATVERRANDTLVITKLWLDPDNHYEAIEKGRHQKPGIYEVSQEGGRLAVKYKTNGRIKSENSRKVVVADTNYIEPLKAAEAARQNLSDLIGDDAALVGDFDLFFSPVGSKLGGMLNYNPLILNQTYLYAGLLADAMEKSNNKSGVIWSSDLSGAVVLSQSIQTLAFKNISFEKQKHVVKMRLPPTDPDVVINAASKLGMLVDKKMAKGNGNIRASVSSLVTNVRRAYDKSDPYSLKDYGKDLTSGALSVTTTVGALGFTAALLVNSPALATVSTITGAAGAIQFATKALRERRKKGGS